MACMLIRLTPKRPMASMSSMSICPNSYGNVQLLVSVLRRARTPMTIAELRNAIGGDPADIKAMVNECIAVGLVSVSADTVRLAEAA